MRRYLEVAGVCAALLLAACESETRKVKTVASATGSAQKLDAMQLSSARRIALESAKEAMQLRSGARLKQLSTWVRNRAQVPVLERDELAALDLAIECLEQVSADESRAALERLPHSQLKPHALKVCGPAP